MDTETRTRQSYRVALVPLPLRVATSQLQRLTEMRDRMGTSVQEHVRRAIDLYLAVSEREQIELGLLDAPSRNRPSLAASNFTDGVEESETPEPTPLRPGGPIPARPRVVKR